MSTKKSTKVVMSAESGFATGTLASALPNQSNKESDIVRQCFQSGNYTQMSSLPDGVNTKYVTEAMEKKTLENLSRSQPRQLTNLQGGGLFMEFEWAPDPFELPSIANLENKEEHKKYVDKLHRGKEWNPAIAHPKLKGEQGFGDNFIEFLSEGDPQSSAWDAEKRRKLLMDSKVLAGDFKPQSLEKSPIPVTKAQMRDIINVLRLHLTRDWDDAKFIIATNHDDHIEVRFDLDTVDSMNGLIAYMNNLVSQAEDVTKFKLRRVVNSWALIDKHSKYIYFMISPPWVKQQRPDVGLAQQHSDKESKEQNDLQNFDAKQE